VTQSPEEAERYAVQAFSRRLDDELIFLAFVRLSESQRKDGESQSWSVGRGPGGWVVRVRDNHGLMHEAVDERLGDAITELANRVMGTVWMRPEGAEA
jgi:hypothetical protein